MMYLHVEGHFIDATKTHEGYTWKVRQCAQLRCMKVTHGGHSGKVTERHISYMWNVTKIQI